MDITGIAVNLDSRSALSPLASCLSNKSTPVISMDI